MHYILSSTNEEMLDRWKSLFKKEQEVVVQKGGFFSTPADAMVSPANCHGYMDAGIDLNISYFFDANTEAIAKYIGIPAQELVEMHWTKLEDYSDGLTLKIQKLVQQATNGFLPVGRAVIIKTGHSKCPYLISAPTIEMPGDTNTAYKAFKAVLKTVEEHNKVNEDIERVICPSLGTGIVGIPHKNAAEQMWQAYCEVNK